MASINDFLSPDLLFNILKRLDSIDMVVVRRTCKLWLEVIDKHKSFWRSLHLPEESVKWNPSIIDSYNEKSDSSIEEVDIRVRVGTHDQDHLFDTLQCSAKTLEHVLIQSETAFYSQTWNSFLEKCQKLISLRILEVPSADCRLVHLKMRSRLSSPSDSTWNENSSIESASPLKVLWGVFDLRFNQMNPKRFQNLVSLDLNEIFTSIQLRSILEAPSENLKHLAFHLEDEVGEEELKAIEKLILPKLEVLEIHGDIDFPPWMLIPSSVKLISWAIIYERFPSVSELWTRDLSTHSSLVNRCPNLKVLRLIRCEMKPDQLDCLLEFLEGRLINVEAGLQVDGTKMEMLETLVIPFSRFQSTAVERLKVYLKNSSDSIELVNSDSLPEIVEVEA